MSLETYIQPILHWVELHPHWAGAFAFMVAFLESTVILGALVPGIVCMTALGGFIGLGLISPYSILLCSIMGAIVGDAMSFALGYCYHGQLRERWPFSRMKTFMAAAEAFFARHGGKSIFFARFAGPLRAFVPVIGGMLRMNLTRYLIANVTSAIVWAPVYLLPGYFIGVLSKTLPPAVAFRLLGLLLVLALLFWLCAFALHRFLGHTHQFIDRQFGALHRCILKKYPHTERWLRDPDDPDSHYSLKILCLILLFSCLLIYTCWQVKIYGHFTDWNIPTWYLSKSIRHPSLDPFFIVLSYFGQKYVVFPVFAAIFAYCAYLRHYRAAIHALLLFAAAVFSALALKHGLHIARPGGLTGVLHDGFSFPSGHCVLATVFYGFFAIVASKALSTAWRSRAYAATLIFVLGIAVSRLYLGEHWLTDVIGGICLGYILLLGFAYAIRRNQVTFPSPVLLTLLISLVLPPSLGLFAYRHYTIDKIELTPVKAMFFIHPDTWWNNNGTEVPFYRFSITGRTSEILNLQWYGSIESISGTLQKQGWRVVENTLEAALARFASRQQLPPFRQSYLDRAPEITLYKPLDDKRENIWLILRLWDGNIRTDKNIPLWVGTVNYSQYTNKGYLHHFQQTDHLQNQQSPTQLLTHDLIDWEYKRLDMEKQWKVPHAEYGHSYYLLIRPAAEPMKTSGLLGVLPFLG